MPNSRSDTSPRKGRTNRILKMLLILGFALLVIRDFPNEVARWHRAKHRHHSLDRDYEAAMVSINNAIRWDDDNYEYWIEKGQTAMQLGQFETSWKCYDHSRELLEKNYQVVRDPDFEIAKVRNGSAYSRALAGKELEHGAVEIAAALKVLPNDPGMIDTSGYIQLRLGNLERALDETHSAVVKSESTYREDIEAIEHATQHWINQRAVKSQLASYDEAMVELILHRSLVYKELGLNDAANRDMERAIIYQQRADARRQPVREDNS